MVEGEGVFYWNNCGVWKKAVEVPEAFICEGAFIKIECFKIPTKRFPFSIFFLGGGGVNSKECRIQETSLGGFFNLFLYNIVYFSI